MEDHGSAGRIGFVAGEAGDSDPIPPRRPALAVDLAIFTIYTG